MRQQIRQCRRRRCRLMPGHHASRRLSDITVRRAGVARCRVGVGRCACAGVCGGRCGRVVKVVGVKSECKNTSRAAGTPRQYQRFSITPPRYCRHCRSRSHKYAYDERHTIRPLPPRRHAYVTCSYDEPMPGHATNMPPLATDVIDI